MPLPKLATFLGFMLLGAILIGCSSDDSQVETSRPFDDAQGELGVSTSTPESTATPPPPTATPEPTPNPSLADDVVAGLLADLVSNNEEKINGALDTITEAGDNRFISVLIELIRAREIGLILGDTQRFVSTLQALSGQGFPANWAAWSEWYNGTDLTPPPGFATWKGELLAIIDSDFTAFVNDDLTTEIRVEEIQWGGVAVDGIVALDNAPMLNGAEVGYLEPTEPVFGLVVNGEARAYPLRIMDTHEMANDVVGGLPISIAYCTLCGAAVAYEGVASDGNTYTFGSSGLLYRSNKLMYDRPTRTLWNQLTGQPVMGELAGSGVTLNVLPIVLTAWEDWLMQHPETLVLDIETGYGPASYYQLGVPYADYFASGDAIFPVWLRNDLLDDKSQIFALRVGNVPIAYPLTSFAEESVINDVVAELNVVLVGSGELVEVLASSEFAGQVNYSAGGEVRAYERGEAAFSPGLEPDTLLDEAGGIWRIEESGLVGPAGQILPVYPAI